jgi:hypothetical protein
MPDVKRKKPKRPKPWRLGVQRLQLFKARERSCWTRSQLRKFGEARDARRKIRQESHRRKDQLAAQFYCLQGEFNQRLSEQRWQEFEKRQRARKAVDAAAAAIKRRNLE